MKKKLLFVFSILIGTTAFSANTEGLPPTKISSEQLINAYKINPSEGDRTYKYKPLIITGKYVSIYSSDRLKKSKPVLILESSDSSFSIKAYGNDNFIPTLQGYMAGQEITLICMGEGLENKTIKISNCSISKN